MHGVPCGDFCGCRGLLYALFHRFLNKIVYYRKYILTDGNVDDIIVAERKVS